MIGELHPTPFHARTAACNRTNAWTTRSGFTVPVHYGDPAGEALAPRMSAAMIDISPLQDLRIHGPGAATMLEAACGASLRDLPSGRSEAVHWCADGGGLRGYGVVSRFGEQEFLLRGIDADIGWFAAASPRFGATVEDVTATRGLLLLSGVYALAALISARLEVSALERNDHVGLDWNGVPVTVFRGTLGYEIACTPEDAVLLFDRVLRAGRLVDLRLAGEQAFHLLHLEAGLPMPHADFAPARENLATTPLPSGLGFPDPEGDGGASGPVLAGLELEAETPVSFVPVYAGTEEVGRTMRGLYSPALKSAVALAQLSPVCARPGTLLSLRAAGAEIPARVVPLPFL